MFSEKLVAPSVQSSNHFGGDKTIGFWGGFNLLANNICGPAIVLLPALFQQAGIIPTTVGLIVITFLAGICSWMMIEAMKLMPGNANLTERHEYMTVAARYLSRPHYWLVFYFYQLSLMSVLMSNVIQTAQVLDLCISDFFSCSYGFAYYPLDDFGTFPCGSNSNSDVEPWTNVWVISIGFIIVAVISVPFGMLNLDDNIILQWIATVGFGIMAIIWVVIFCEKDTFSTDNVPWVGNNFSQLVGVILFNYGYIVTLPSWANEKKPGVSTTKTLIVSLGFMLVIFYIVGIFGGMAYKPYYNTDKDIFDELIKKGDTNLTSRITVYMEPIIQNITSIPIFSIILRYNFIDLGFSKWSSTFWSVIFPWVLCLPLYNGNGFNDLCNWAGVILAAYVNFIVPPYLFIWAFMENRANTQPAGLQGTVEERNANRKNVKVSSDNHDISHETNSTDLFRGNYINEVKHPLAIAWSTYAIMWIISIIGIIFTMLDAF